MWTRTVTLVLGKLLSSSWCFLKIYTADKNFTRPPVALVAPNINPGHGFIFPAHFCFFCLWQYLCVARTNVFCAKTKSWRCASWWSIGKFLSFIIPYLADVGRCHFHPSGKLFCRQLAQVYIQNNISRLFATTICIACQPLIWLEKCCSLTCGSFGLRPQTSGLCKNRNFSSTLWVSWHLFTVGLLLPLKHILCCESLKIL